MILAKNPLFQSLIADRRWPHFSVAYQRYLGNKELNDVGAPSFGESFSLYRFAGPWESTMEVGIQAGVFSIFDLDSQSHDLVNADYLVGLPLSVKNGNFSTHTSVYHQSSHLGDEFLLHHRTQERVNLSYEGISHLFSYHCQRALGFMVAVDISFTGTLPAWTPGRLMPASNSAVHGCCWMEPYGR